MTHRERNRRWATSHGRRLVRRRTYDACVDACLCVTCQAAPAEPDRVRCATCQDYHREAKRTARATAREAHCLTVATEAPAQGSLFGGAP